MSKFKVAIVGGGIAGLALAGALLKQGNIQVDVYEASNKFDEIGAGITLWGRVCEALQLMGLADDCIKAAMVSASTKGLSTTASAFRMRGFHQMDQDFGCLPLRDAWHLHRADLLHILLRHVPRSHAHLGKKIRKYIHDDASQTTTLKFADGTSATCDVLIGCDGIRSPTRGQMMRQEAEATGSEAAARCIEARWTGIVAYRILTPAARLAARNPTHGMLTGGQVYFGKGKHVVGYPISPTTLNIAVNITDLSKENTRWPAPSWSLPVDRQTIAETITPLFAGWDEEPLDIIETTDSAIEWAIHDLEPLPFYAKGRVALIGDAAHAAMPYIGAGAAHAIEDAYVLARILCASATTRETLPLALEAYQIIRLPYGNRHILGVREAVRAFQYNGPDGDDMPRVAQTINRIFDEVAGTGESGSDADANKAIAWLEKKVARAQAKS